MAEITNVRMNTFELKRTDVNDPVAAKVSWNPARPGGSNFRTHQLRASHGLLTVVRSKGMILFGGVFALIGGAVALFGISPYSDPDIVARVIVVLFGSVFCAVGVATLRGNDLLTFDRGRGIYFRGRRGGRTPGSRTQQGPLSEIHALQIISETVSGSKGGSFVSTELNIVFKDGERTNVMDHGDAAAIEEAARQLAAFLDVPVWKAVY